MLPMIKVTNLSKRYKIGARLNNDNFRETIAAWLKSCVRPRSNATASKDESEIWALRDLNLEIRRGDVVGVVGRNGGGKSTLLKVLSRITEPTEGTVELYGRVGSLLEVGTGFHPELTGRENIFLNGAILGMKRAEISRKFDEIVEFSGVERFLDTAVKRYSSGMYVRLAFAVAAHLEPEILLVDEVLAVGDTEFQKKCLGKMGEIAREGRTVVFVSHNLVAVESLCSSAILLDSGQIRMSASARDVVSEYARMTTERAGMTADLRNHSGRRPDAQPVMTGVSVLGLGGQASVIRMGDGIRVDVSFHSSEPFRPCCGFTIKTEYNVRICHVSDRFSDQLSSAESTRSGVVSCSIENLSLMPGRYLLDIWLETFTPPRPMDMIVDACWFEVSPTDLLGSGKLPSTTEGPVFVCGQWRIEAAESPGSDAPEVIEAQPA